MVFLQPILEAGCREHVLPAALLEEVAVGDYVLVHVGYALHKLSEEEAERTLQLMAEAGVLAEELEEMAGAPVAGAGA